MTFERIAVVPGEATVTRVSDRGRAELSIRSVGRFDELAAALGERLGLAAQVYDGLGPMPGQGTLVVCRPDVLWQLGQVEAAMPWVVGVDLTRSRALAECERHGLAAAVEADDFAGWVDGTPRPPALYGVAATAAAFGATAATRPDQRGPRYARLTHPALADLPALLAAYLTAYAR
jgi:hypothetical protein